jgi:hypothetical protein
MAIRAIQKGTARLTLLSLLSLSIRSHDWPSTTRPAYPALQPASLSFSVNLFLLFGP